MSPLRPGWWMSPTRPPRIPAVAATPRRHGRIDVLLNDAGCAVRGVIEEVPGAAVEAMVDVNVLGVSRMVRPVAAVCDNAAGTLSDGKRGDHLGLRGGLHGHRAVSRSG